MEHGANGVMTHDRLRIYLFGEPRLEVGGQMHVFKAPPKTLPMLAYLLLNRRGPIAREKIAAALWPDSPQAEAYANVRRHLHYLAKALPPANGSPWVIAGAKAIAWNAESSYWVDVEAFETEVQERALRARAVRLYSGDLYERCAEEWIDFERERLRTLQLSALAQLCGAARERSAYVEALQYSQLMLAADPWREDALRAIMETRMLLGDRSGAIAEYERFAERLRTELQTQPLAETMQAYEQIRRSTQVDRRANGSTKPAVTLVGRRNELATLLDEWQRASRGEGRALFIGGEAGIGKTTLVTALAEAVAESGGEVLTGAAAEHEESAYTAFAGIAHALGADIFAPLSAEEERLRLFETVADLLARRAAEAPVIVVLEDLHWAGNATLDMLRYVVLRLSRSPVLFVGTYREFEISRALRALRRQLVKSRRSTNLALSALSRDEAFALACFCAGRTLPDDLLQRVYERSDGNPLFVVELVRELRESGLERVPDSIAEIVRERLARLNEAARSLLHAAAIAGASPSAELLADVTGMREGDVLQRLDELVTSHFLRQGSNDQLCFVHDVIRQALYEAVTDETARTLHARVGFALRRLYDGRFGEIAANAAWHFERGGVIEDAADAYVVAAEHALDIYASEEAFAYAGKAYENAGDPQRRFRCVRVMELVAGMRADRETQRRYLNELLSLGETLDEKSRAEALLRAVDFTNGEPADAQRAAVDALERFVSSAPQYVPAFLLRAGEFQSRIGSLAEATKLLQKALEAFTGGSDVEALLRCLTALYAAALRAGHPLDALDEQIGRARANLERHADARVAARLCHVHSGVLLDRDPAAAHAAGLEMLEHARTAGDRWLEALAHRSIGAAATRRMLIGQAQQHFARSAEISVMAGRLRDVALVRNWQIMAENRCANFVAAAAFGKEGLDTARTCGADDAAASILANLSNTAVWARDLDTAEQNLRESLRMGEERAYAQASIKSLSGGSPHRERRSRGRRRADRAGSRRHLAAGRRAANTPRPLPALARPRVPGSRARG